MAGEEIGGRGLTGSRDSGGGEAGKIANDSSYGLSGRMVPTNTAEGLQVARRLRTGSVMISGGISGPGASTFMVAPFGGFKESGIGREGGKYGVLEYTEIQTIAL